MGRSQRDERQGHRQAVIVVRVHRCAARDAARVPNDGDRVRAWNRFSACRVQFGAECVDAVALFQPQRGDIAKDGRARRETGGGG